MTLQTSGKAEESPQSICSREGLPRRNAKAKDLGQDRARQAEGIQPPPDRDVEGPTLDLCWRELPGCGDSLEPDKELQGVALLTPALGEEQTGDRREAILKHLFSVK